MKRFLNCLLQERSGQSLIEIMIGLSIGAILIGTASLGIAFILRSSSTNQNLGVASEAAQGLLEKVRSFSNAGWQNVYGLQKGSSTQYFLVASGTSLFAVQGKEGILDNDVTSGLVGEWGFDEDPTSTSTTTYDLSGNVNNGTLSATGMTRLGSGCVVGNCASSDGVNGQINLGSSTGYDSSSFTLSLWLKPTTLKTGIGGANGNIFLGRESYLTSGFRAGISGTAPVGQISFWTSQSGGTLSLNSGTTYVSTSTNAWYHVVVTYASASSTGTMYINGSQVNSSAGSYVAPVGRSLVVDGGVGGVEFLNGSFDNVRWYNRALSAAEVSQLYKSGIFGRYFYVENVCRSNDASSTITSVSPCGGGSVDDPLTQKATAVTEWISDGKTAQFSLATYLTRWKNFLLRQTDWSGGAGTTGPVTVPDNSYASGTNVTTTPLGSFRIQNLSQ